MSYNRFEIIINENDVVTFVLFIKPSQRIFIEGIVSQIQYFTEHTNLFIKDVNPQIFFQYSQSAWILFSSHVNEYCEAELLINPISFPDFMPALGQKVFFEILANKNKKEVVAGREFQTGVRYVIYEGRKIVQAGLILPVFEPDKLFWEPKFLSNKGEWKYQDQKGQQFKVNLSQ